MSLPSFELHISKDGHLESKYLSLCLVFILVALISHQMNLPLQQMDTITKKPTTGQSIGHKRSWGVKPQLRPLQHDSCTEGSGNISEDVVERLILRARGPGNLLSGCLLETKGKLHP